MTSKTPRNLGAGELIVAIVIAAVWLALKLGYREIVKQQHGFLSWAYLRADLVSLVVILVVTLSSLWLLRRLRRRSA